MSADSLFKSQAVTLLDSVGFNSRVLPEGTSQSADLEATDPSGQLYLLELKTRTISWQAGAAQPAAEAGSDAFQRTDPTTPSNSLARVFDKAADQLASSAHNSETLKLLWFAAEPTDRDYHYRRIFNTAYGITNVTASARSVKQGFYVRHAAFAARPEGIDGVLLGGFAALLLNDLSPRYARIKASQLAAQLGEFVIDPPAIHARGECYYLDPRESGATPERSVDRLVQRYGLANVQLVDLTRFGATVGTEGV